MTTLNYGDSAARLLSRRIGGQTATTATMALIPANRRSNGSLYVTLDTMSLWVYDAASVIAASATIIEPSDSVGRYRRLAAAAAA